MWDFVLTAVFADLASNVDRAEHLKKTLQLNVVMLHCSCIAQPPVLIFR